VLQKTLEALASQADEDGRITLFESNASFQGDGAFQLGEARPSGETRAALPLGLFAFRTTSVRRKFLFVKWNTDAVELFASASELIFNQDDYAPLRPIVQSKLGSNRLDRLARLQVPAA